jgi:hypothetical protein
MLETIVMLWWQWLNSIQKEANPAVDSTGKHVSQGQNHPTLFFLAGTTGGYAERSATITAAGKRILLSPINCVTSESEDPNMTWEQRAAEVKEDIDSLAEMNYKISDNLTIVDFRRVPLYTPFEIDGADTSVFSNFKQSGKQRIVSDGYYLLTAPLSKGRYELNFVAKENPSRYDPNGFENGVKYHLEVE